MQKIDYVIIGGGIAGTTAAEFIRMNDASGTIAIISEEPEFLYSRVLLPYYLRDQVPIERLYIRKEEQYSEKNIELRKGIRANKINTQKKKVELSSGEIIDYGKLLIASGGKVNRLDVSGEDLKGITYMRTFADVAEIKGLMKKAKNAAVIGGGFIGIEFAQTFVKAGIKTTVVMRDPYFWSPVIGENMGRLVSKILQENNMEIVPETEPTKFVGDKNLREVKLKNGKFVQAEIAGVGIGIHSDLDFLAGSSIKTNKGVLANEYLETETKDVWTAGDVAEFRDESFGKSHLLGNWSNAAVQGKVAGSNMVAGWSEKAGEREKFITVSAYTIGIFDNSFTFMGDPTIDSQTEIIERGSVQDRKSGRIYLRDGVITGAALINLPADRRPIEELIKRRVKMTTGREKLSDTRFDLSKLTPNQL